MSLVPSEASAIIATATVFSTLASEHVVHSFGRRNNHTCDAFMLTLQTTNAFNDVLLSQSGEDGGVSNLGTSSGTIVIPLTADNYLEATLGMAFTGGTAYINLLVYGYMVGDFVLPVDDVRNILHTTSGGMQNFMVDPGSLPYPASSLFTSMSTYTPRDDHFTVIAGRESSAVAAVVGNEPFSDSLDFYGDVGLAHVSGSMQ